ncbi:MAG: YcxB family protein [Dokdonella sp.]
MHQTFLHYNKPLVLQAVRGFWWRVVGWRFLGALALVAVGLIVSLCNGDTSWVVGVLGSVLVFAIAFVVALYVVHYRNALYKLNALGSKPATLEASETSLSLSSAAGTATLPWAAVSDVWQFKTCWLLVLSKSQFVTLPLASLPPELAQFVLARVRASGGNVS